MKQKDSIKNYLLEIPNYLAVFIFPLFFLTLSPILLDISASTGIEIGDLSLVFTFFTIGNVIGQLTSILYNRKYRSLTVIVASLIILIPITLVLARVKDLYAFCILYFIAGYLLGVIWLQANQNIMRSRVKNKERIIALTLSFYPIGAVIAPYISSGIVSRGMDWQILYYMLVFLISLVIVLYLTITRRIDYLSLKPDKRIPFKEIFIDKNRNILFIFTAIMLMVYVMSETVLALWAPTFFRSERLFDVRDAALLISLFWVGLLAGRVITGIIAGKIKLYYLILILSTIGFISSIIIYFFESKSAIFAMMVIIGLGFSSIFPLLVSFGSTIYSSGTGLLLTILFTSANIGISIAPSLTRSLSRFGMLLSISLVPIFMMVFIILTIFVIIYSRRSKSREELPGG